MSLWGSHDVNYNSRPHGLTSCVVCATKARQICHKKLFMAQGKNEPPLLTTCDLLCSMLLASLEVFVPCVLLRKDKQMYICVYILYIYICACISQCWPAPVCLQYLSEIYLDFLQVAKEDVDMKRNMLPVTHTHSRDSWTQTRALWMLNSSSACACHTLQAISSTDRSMIKHVELDVGDESFGSPTPPPTVAATSRYAASTPN